MEYQAIAITGGWGLLGQHLIVKLRKRYPTAWIKVLDLKPHRHPAHDITRVENLTFEEADITDADTLTKTFKGIDLVLHLAGYISFWSGERDHLFEVNQTGTRNVVTAAREEGVKKLIHVSSVAAVGYNNKEHEPIDEDFRFDWDSCGDKYYMLSKHHSEEEVRNCADGMDYLIACPGLMFGPGDLNNSIAFINAIRFKRMPASMPGGTNVIDARDVADGLLVLMEKGQSCERYLLSGHNLKFTEINQTIAEAVGVRPPRVVAPRILHKPLYWLASAAEKLTRKKPPVTADNIDSAFMFRYFDNTKARQLGWEPKTPFSRTIQDTYAWMQTLPEDVQNG